METNKSKQKITDLLKQKGIQKWHGRVQLFADQYDDSWAISVNFSGTGLHIPKSEIDERELAEDEDIQVCKSWTYREKEE